MSVVVKYIDLDDNFAELANSGELKGKVGSQINYRTADEIEKLLAAGYVLVNNSFDPNNEVKFFDQGSQEYRITFKHGQEEVTAQNLNYGCQLNDVQIKGKQVIHYTGMEEEIFDNVFDIIFNRKLIYDKVTKQKLSISAWQPEKNYLPLIATPAVLNYTPDKAIAGGEAATIQKPKLEYVVTYHPNKKNARRQKAEIKFVDLDDNNKELATSGELKGKPGKEIPYNTAEVLKELTDKGYEVVINNFDSTSKKPTFGNSKDSIQTFIIVLRHKKQVVNSDHPFPSIDQNLYQKEIHRRISFSGLEDQKLDDVIQTAVLKRSLTLDLVTKKIIPGKYTSQWKSNETYPPVSVPVISGYHTETKEVAACFVGNEDLNVELKYYKNGYLVPVDVNQNEFSEISKKQLITNSIDPTKVVFPKLELENITLKPVKEVEIENPGRDYKIPYLMTHKYVAVNEDNPRNEVSPAYYRRIVTARVNYQGAGDQTPATAEQTVRWTRTITYDEVSKQVIDNGMYTSQWMADKDVFKATPTPIVRGFCANIGLIGEHPVTETDLMATVTYRPVGRMLPIDEHGNEIQNVMPLPYVNDPYDPVRVLFTEEVPEVPGYAPVHNTISVNDPFKDIKVVYTLKPRYMPVNSDHPYRPIKPTLYSVPVKETIRYQGAGSQTPTTRLQAARWTRTLTVDENTSELIENGKYTTPWEVDKKQYIAVKTPVIDGYHADKNLIKEKEVKKADIDVLVTYKQNGRIIPVNSNGNIIENAELPLYVTDPDDATKVIEKQGVPRIMNYIPQKEVIFVQDAERDTKVTYYTFSEMSNLRNRKHQSQNNITKVEEDKKQEKQDESKEEGDITNKVQKNNNEQEINKTNGKLKSIFPWMK